MRWPLAQRDEGSQTAASLLQSVEQVLGYQFQDPELLLQALTHSSYSNELVGEYLPVPDNERLEFLGDAVIGLVIAELLMARFPTACEGKMSRWRSSLVSRKTLAQMAQGMALGEKLRLGRGERRTGGAEKRSILAAGFEAVVGAIYLDGGLGAATVFLRKVFGPWIETLVEDSGALRFLDRKTHLQERTQSLYKKAPEYHVIDVWGPEHEKCFRVEIRVGDQVLAQGDGRSKKEAEQEAASRALEIIGF